MYQAGYAVGQLIAFLLFLTPAVFFLLTQQNTLKAIRRENRRLRPGLVWLQLIPIFNFCWMFVVVTRVADSLYKENVSLMDDSILGVPVFRTDHLFQSFWQSRRCTRLCNYFPDPVSFCYHLLDHLLGKTGGRKTQIAVPAGMIYAFSNKIYPIFAAKWVY